MQIRNLIIIACLKMAIRYASAHRGLISFLSFFFNITITNSFVQREGNVASAAVLPVAQMLINLFADCAYLLVKLSFEF